MDTTTPVTGEIKARLREIEARLKAATPAPWTTTKPVADGSGFASGVIVAAVQRGMGIYASPDGGSFPYADQTFIAHAPSDIAYLLERVRVLDRASGDGVRVPTRLDRAELDKLSNLLTCTDEEGVETWAAIIEIFNSTAALSAVSIPRGEVADTKLADKMALLRTALQGIHEQFHAVQDNFDAISWLHGPNPLPPAGGWRLVPVEPTCEMVDAGHNGTHASDPSVHVIPIYKAMLAAAPAPPASDKETA